jgi:epoxyqueuosine reductase
MNNWAFGCDVCQDVCPWNRFSKPTTIKEFKLKSPLLNLSREEWHEIDEHKFSILTKNSPIKRTKLKGISRNLSAISEI